MVLMVLMVAVTVIVRQSYLKQPVDAFEKAPRVKCQNWTWLSSLRSSRAVEQRGWSEMRNGRNMAPELKGIACFPIHLRQYK